MDAGEFDEVISLIYQNRFTDIEKLFKSGLDVRKKDNEGRTILFHAVLDDNPALVSFFIKKGFEVNVQDNLGWTPLHYCVQDHQTEIAKILIENGADLEIKDNYGNTALFRAAFASQGKGDVIRLLLEHGANRDSKNNAGVSPLQLANTIANYNVKQFFE
ncbi:ankyrin repeat domain-containing protein [Sphingobacterium siyangense]|uniref:ankyrin repeat domain-containing protein n=1 Tax=Sphingobacterium siyangense TaxID=459529 RepID=UPI0019629A4E|nr:ankyrin repeat domain-containing protein [Sphingobacterium siyangense]QRY58006.1 ankyrin repeat domain-containing protein [Sphingobacterium siyangense]